MIGELARLLPPEREIEFTTDPDRILALAPTHGANSRRAPVRAALAGGSRETIVVELAREVDRLQQQDRARVARYKAASEAYLREFQAAHIASLDLRVGHERIYELAEHWLPRNPLISEDGHGAAQ